VTSKEEVRKQGGKEVKKRSQGMKGAAMPFGHSVGSVGTGGLAMV
jgi:hypothetical protein